MVRYLTFYIAQVCFCVLLQLDDKRQEAEKKLLLLNVKYESLINQYDLSKKQMSKVKVSVSSLAGSVRMSRSGVELCVVNTRHRMFSKNKFF